MNSIEEFIILIEQFALRHGMSDTSVSTFLAKSPGYLKRLRNGKDTGSRKMISLKQKMAAYDLKMGKI